MRVSAYMHEDACVAGSRKGGDAVEGGCISGRADLEVSAVATWSGYGGMALSVLRSYCHRSIFHFNEVPKPNPYYLFIH